MDEHEQGELVRSWLRKNSGALFGGIAIGLVGILGWQWWQGSQTQHKLDAASAFHSLESAVESKQAEQATQLSKELSSKFANTPYGALGLISLAEFQLDQGDKAAAQVSLQEAAKLSQDKSLASLAYLRLARIQLAEGKAQEAMDSLSKIAAGDFAGLAGEIRGDALLALGRTAEAGSAYQEALVALETGAPNRSIVEMKLADLGVPATEPGA